MPNKLSKFWQELKRRNVTRVLAVYIAAAFMILELISMFSEPLGLPEGTLIVVFFISLAGLVLAVIVSWIYDIRPEVGMVKTEPAEKVIGKDVPKSSNSWKIASYISFVVIVGLIVLNIVPRSGINENLDKSIAVLPFINDSEDKGNEHFISGIMDEIIMDLQTIGELRVPGRISIEQYRNSTKSIPEIAKELAVNYIVGGSGQKYENTFILRVRLMDAVKDKQIWSGSYNEEITTTDDLVSLQNKIAETISSQIEAVITPEERQLIEKKPTNSLNAHYLFMEGREEFWKSANDTDPKHLINAEDLYRKALQYDSSYAQAYSGLAMVYLQLSFMNDVTSVEILDSALIFTDKALLYDGQMAEAYSLRGAIFQITGKHKRAFEAFDKAIELNPNEWMAYGFKYGYFLSQGDQVAALENAHKAAALHHGPLYPAMLSSLGHLYIRSGFNDKAEYYIWEAFSLNHDSLNFYESMAWNGGSTGNYITAIDNLKKVLSIDAADTVHIADLVTFLGIMGKYEEALKWCNEYFEDPELINGFTLQSRMHRIGLIFWESGYKEVADEFFTKQIESSNEIIESEIIDDNSYYAYLDLASVYAFKGENDQVYENLSLFNTKNFIPQHIVTLIKDDPLFNNIRDEPEFQQIVRDIESKYQAEHERVRKWLEENDLL